MHECKHADLDRLKLAMLDSQENLLDFFTMNSLERTAGCWLDVRVEPANVASRNTSRVDTMTLPAEAERQLRLA